LAQRRVVSAFGKPGIHRSNCAKIAHTGNRIETETRNETLQNYQNIVITPRTSGRISQNELPDRNCLKGVESSPHLKITDRQMSGKQRGKPDFANRAR
jgi:hypothetical protein